MFLNLATVSARTQVCTAASGTSFSPTCCSPTAIPSPCRSQSSAGPLAPDAASRRSMVQKPLRRSLHEGVLHGPERRPGSRRGADLAVDVLDVVIGGLGRGPL